MSKELPARSEVKTEDKWDLTPLYESVEDWEKDFERVLDLSDEIALFEGKVCDSARNLYDCLVLSDEMDRVFHRVYTYAGRLYDVDTADAEHLSMISKVRTRDSELMAKTAFVSTEISAADEEMINAFIDIKPELALYKREIMLMIRKRPHKLSNEMEQLLASSYDCTSTSEDVFSILSNADLEFGEIKDDTGETVRITQGRYISLVSSPDRKVREDAFRTYYSSYKQLKNTYAALYFGHVKTLKFYSRSKKFDSSLEAALFSNEIPTGVYETLIETVNKHLDKLHRYIDIRKKCLGLDTFRMYDIYPPMVKDVKLEYTYEEAKELVLKALKPLGEEYIKVVKSAYEDRWIDVYENKNKRSGAYSAATYGVHPYMLLNYDGKLNDVFTLAHEMGHSVHSYYSNKTQPYVYSSYKIFVAEVASTCNEILLLKYMLNNTTDKHEHAYLLNHYLDMFKGTLFRQTQFAEFELETNRMVEKDEVLTADALCDLYDNINRKYYGANVEYDEEIKYEWERIPHFYYNFYVYQYSTSFCASVTIAERLLKDPSYVEKYIDFLSSGCSDTPLNLLKKVDVDMETSEPIENAIEIMSKVMDEFEEIVNDSNKQFQG